MRLVFYASLIILFALNITVSAQQDIIQDSEISPNGDRLAVADNTAVWIYTLPDLIVEAVLPIEANAVSWSPDNDLLAVGAQNGNVVEWAISTRTAIRYIGHTDPVLDVEWAAGGDYIASVSRDSIRAWQVGVYGNSIFLEETPFDYAADVAISPDGQRLSSGTVGGQLVIWATEGGSRIPAPAALGGTRSSIAIETFGWSYSEKMAFAAWSQDGQRFLGNYGSRGQSGSQAMIVYDSSEIRRNEELFDIEVEDVTAAPMFSPNGEKLARVHGSRVDILDAEAWDLLQTINATDEVLNADWTPNNKAVILTTRDSVEFYDLWTESVVLGFTHADQISGGQLSDSQFVTNDGEIIQTSVVVDPSRAVAASTSEIIPLATPINPAWLTNTGAITPDNASQLEILKTLEVPFEYQGEWKFDWSTDGRVLVTSGGSFAPVSVIWFIEDEGGLSDPIRVDFGGSEVIFSRDGRLFALVNSNNIQIWDIDAREEVQQIDLPGSIITEAFAISPDGTRIITGNRNAQVQVWDVDSGELIHELSASDRVLSVAYSPDNQWIAAGMRDGAVLVWNANTFERVLSLRFEPTRSSDGVEVYQLDFTPDGEYLVGYEIGVDALAIWEIASGQSIPVDPQTVQSSDIVFHPSETLLASIHLNHIWILDYRTGEIRYDEQTGSLYGTGRADAFTVDFPDDASLIFLGIANRTDGFEIWNWQSDQLLASYTGTQQTDYITRGEMRLHPNGALVAVQDGPTRIQLYGFR